MIGGGEEHKLLVKMAAKKLLDDFSIREVHLSFEEQNINVQIQLSKDSWGETFTNFKFRPDMVARAWKAQNTQELMMKRQWKSILDSSFIVFEAETDPRNIFSNVLKMESYRQIRRSDFGRETYSFVLVVFDDAKLPENTEPFDEVWRLKRP